MNNFEAGMESNQTTGDGCPTGATLLNVAHAVRQLNFANYNL